MSENYQDSGMGIAWLELVGIGIRESEYCLALSEWLVCDFDGVGGAVDFAQVDKVMSN
jgi:hypothetical protein